MSQPLSIDTKSSTAASGGTATGGMFGGGEWVVNFRGAASSGGAPSWLIAAAVLGAALWFVRRR
jgi:hypothetical protein